MITAVQPSKRKGKNQQVIQTGNLPERRNITRSAFSLERKAYQNPIRKESALVQTSRAAVISGATPFSIPIRYSSFNLNANNEALKFTPRSGSLPRIVGEEPGDYGDREAVRFHKRGEEGEEGEEGEKEKGEKGKEGKERIKTKLAQRKDIFFGQAPSESVQGLTKGAESFARIADLAYQEPSERDLSFFTQNGFVEDEDYSNDEHVVLINPNNGEVIVGIRGTAFNLNNLLTDATIALGHFEDSERARKTIELRERLLERYPYFTLHFTGHSMGGTAAAYAAEGLPNATATTFNAGSTPFGGAIETAENVTNYRTEGDAISQGIQNAITIPKQCPSSLAHSSSQFVPGAPCEKPGLGSLVKNTLEAAANVAAKTVKSFSPMIPPEIKLPLKAASKVTAKIVGKVEKENRAITRVQPMQGIDYAQPMEIEAPPQRRQLPAPPPKRQITGVQPMQGIDYAQPMEIEAPPQRRQLPAPPPKRRQLPAPPQKLLIEPPQKLLIEPPVTSEIELQYSNKDNYQYRLFQKFLKKNYPNDPVPSKADFVKYLRATKQGKTSSMDWQQTAQDLGIDSSKSLPIDSLKKPVSTAVKKTIESGKSIIPLLEYSAGGIPASTSRSIVPREKATKMTADRTITAQEELVLEKRTRQREKENDPLELKYIVKYWKGKEMPKNPKKKRNESKEEFEKRVSDYKQFKQLWVIANKRRQPLRKAKE